MGIDRCWCASWSSKSVAGRSRPGWVQFPHIPAILRRNIMPKCVLVCVTRQKTSEKLIKKGVELTKGEEGSCLNVIHVVNENDKLLYNLSDGDALEYLFEITKDVGAANLVVKRSKDVIKTIVDYAGEINCTHIVLGNSNNPSNNFVVKLQRKLPNVEFIV